MKAQLSQGMPLPVPICSLTCGQTAVAANGRKQKIWVPRSREQNGTPFLMMSLINRKTVPSQTRSPQINLQNQTAWTVASGVGEWVKKETRHFAIRLACCPFAWSQWCPWWLVQWRFWSWPRSRFQENEAPRVSVSCGRRVLARTVDPQTCQYFYLQLLVPRDYLSDSPRRRSHLSFAHDRDCPSVETKRNNDAKQEALN